MTGPPSRDEEIDAIELHIQDEDDGDESSNPMSSPSLDDFEDPFRNHCNIRGRDVSWIRILYKFEAGITI